LLNFQQRSIGRTQRQPQSLLKLCEIERCGPRLGKCSPFDVLFLQRQHAEVADGRIGAKEVI
jgi:hypothetical protein